MSTLWLHKITHAILKQIKLAEYNYMLQFLKKLKLCTKLVSRQYMKVLTSKLIYNNLYLLFVIFIIYLPSSKNKSIFCNWNLTLNDWFICNVKNRGNFCGGKCPWLMYMICPTRAYSRK